MNSLLWEQSSSLPFADLEQRTVLPHSPAFSWQPNRSSLVPHWDKDTPQLCWPWGFPWNRMDAQFHWNCVPFQQHLPWALHRSGGSAPATNGAAPSSGSFQRLSRAHRSSAFLWKAKSSVLNLQGGTAPPGTSAPKIQPCSSTKPTGQCIPCDPGIAAALQLLGLGALGLYLLRSVGVAHTARELRNPGMLSPATDGNRRLHHPAATH